MVIRTRSARSALAFMTLATATHAAPPLPSDAVTGLGAGLVVETDPTTASGLRYAGRGERYDYDSQGSANVLRSAYLFEAIFRDAPSVEISVSPELGVIPSLEFTGALLAHFQASRYAMAFGRIPRALRTSIPAIHIQRGNLPFFILADASHYPIFTDVAEQSAKNGTLEEMLLSGAAKASLNPAIATAPDWIAAQVADGEFVSNLAHIDAPDFDVPESFLAYLAARYFPERIGATKVAAIAAAIPHRIDYFNSLGLNLQPLVLDFVLDARAKGLFNNPSMPGQGLALDIDDHQHWIEGIWYTTSPETGTPAWYRVSGAAQRDGASELLVETSVGAQFASNTPASVVRFGTARLTFSDCDHLVLEYSLLGETTRGHIAMSRELGAPDGCANTLLPPPVDTPPPPPPPPPLPPPPPPAQWTIGSANFQSGGHIPVANACSAQGGQNASPAFEWSTGFPQGDVASLALIMDDETPPCGTGQNACVHWSAYNLPASLRSVAAGSSGTLPTPTAEGRTYNGQTGYQGPCPPFAHTYTTEVFALKTGMPVIPAGTFHSRASFRSQYAEYVIGSATMTGTFP